jgi:hypothetical protein
MPREKLPKLRLKKFQEPVIWAYERSKFCRQLYKNVCFEPEDICRFRNLPVFLCMEYMGSPERTSKWTDFKILVDYIYSL